MQKEGQFGTQNPRERQTRVAPYHLAPIASTDAQSIQLAEVTSILKMIMYPLVGCPDSTYLRASPASSGSRGEWLPSREGDILSAT